MLILGVDPGTALTGYGLVEQQGQRLTAQTYGTIRTAAGRPLAERLKQIYDRMTVLIQEYKPDVLVVEELFLIKTPDCFSGRPGRALFCWPPRCRACRLPNIHRCR